MDSIIRKNLWLITHVYFVHACGTLFGSILVQLLIIDTASRVWWWNWVGIPLVAIMGIFFEPFFALNVMANIGLGGPTSVSALIVNIFLPFVEYYAIYRYLKYKFMRWLFLVGAIAFIHILYNAISQTRIVFL